MPKNNNRTVWSSEQGDVRKKNHNTISANSLPPQQQTVYLHRESSGRGGKAVTLVKNLVLSAGDLKALAKKLKQDCGTGGTIKDSLSRFRVNSARRLLMFCGSWDIRQR